MAEQYLELQHVAVVGAGVSGVAAAVHLQRTGLDVTVFERSSRAGGIWVFDERTAKDAAYPSILPSKGDSPEYAQKGLSHNARRDSPMRDVKENANIENTDELAISFAPPGPCYIALQNNVSTIEMEMSCHSWKSGTAEFVPHHVLADYIQDTVDANGIKHLIHYNTRVTHIQKDGSGWKVETARLTGSGSNVEVETRCTGFDAVVIATGHYHACKTPDLPRLADWKHKFPGRIRHSKLYRRPDEFKDQRVLLIGAGVSSVDIAKDLGNVASSVFQSSRGGAYDLPSHLLPPNAARVGAIRSFDDLSSSELAADGSLPGTITLESGQKLCNVHQVIVCTGYHVSFDFARQYHADGVEPQDASEETLVTDGQVTHNLHKDIWYIPDPTMAFIGVPYHTATFTLFEFQAMALAFVFSGQVPLPSREKMREEYRERISRKGVGRTFHSLKKCGQEIEYVSELVNMVNEHLGDQKMVGHSEKWIEAYARRRERQTLLFSRVRDPTLDHCVLEHIARC